MTKKQAAKKFAEKMTKEYSWKTIFEFYYREYLDQGNKLEIATQWEMHLEINDILQEFFKKVKK